MAWIFRWRWRPIEKLSASRSPVQDSGKASGRREPPDSVDFSAEMATHREADASRSPAPPTAIERLLASGRRMPRRQRDRLTGLAARRRAAAEGRG